MSIRNDAIDALVAKCKGKFTYEDIVNENSGTVDYKPIIELVLDTIVNVWGDSKNAD
jgi:hypothetical protein